MRYRGLVLPLDFVHHETDSPVPSIYVIMPYVKGATLRALIDDGAVRAHFTLLIACLAPIRNSYVNEAEIMY